VDEIRAIRQRISARFDHDPARMIAFYIGLRERFGDRLIDAIRSGEYDADALAVPPSESGI
jgi:hypothetical protein